MLKFQFDFERPQLNQGDFINQSKCYMMGINNMRSDLAGFLKSINWRNKEMFIDYKVWNAITEQLFYSEKWQKWQE